MIVELTPWTKYCQSRVCGFLLWLEKGDFTINNQSTLWILRKHPNGKRVLRLSSIVLTKRNFMLRIEPQWGHEPGKDIAPAFDWD